MDYDQAPRWGATPEDEGDEFVSHSKSKSRTTFLQRWMTRETPAAEPDEDREDSAEETPEGRKKKRFRKLFKKLFPSITTAEKAEPDENPRMGLFAELVPSKPEQSKPPIKPSEKSEANPELSMSSSKLDIPASEQVSEETDSQVEAEPPVEHGDNKKTETSPGVPSTSEQTSYLPPAPEVPPPIFTAPAPRRNYDPVAAVLDHPGLHNPLDRPPQTEISKVENSKNSGVLTAFLAADFLSRRRDRKIRRELKKLNKEVIKKDELKPQVPPTSERPPLRHHQDIQKQVHTERPTTTKHEAPRQQELIQAAPIAEAAPRPRIETATVESFVSVEEKPIQVDDLEDKIAELKKESVRQQETIHSTEIFLQQREQQLVEMRRRSEAPPAIEQEDSRKEKDFDRRHEVLDESPKKVPSMVGAEVPLAAPLPSIGDVLRERVNVPRVAQPSTSPASDGGNVPQTSSTMYQQSVQYGVGAALVILVLAVVARILI